MVNFLARKFLDSNSFLRAGGSYADGRVRADRDVDLATLSHTMHQLNSFSEVNSPTRSSTLAYYSNQVAVALMAGCVLTVTWTAPRTTPLQYRVFSEYPGLPGGVQVPP